MQAGKYFFVSLLCIFLASCISSRPAPVHSDDRGLREPQKRYRTVVPGDTLFSIAWETGRDYRQLARWNNIDSSFLIKPGQKILLFQPDKRDRSGAGGKNSSRYRVARGDTLYSIARRHGLTASGLAAKNRIKPPYRIMPGQTLVLADGGHKKTVSKSPRSASKRSKKPSVSTRKASKPYKGKWRWPTKGRLIGKYTGKGKKKGIEIAGKRGQAIRASAAGSVVYRGSGLRGYGRLIILKHDDDYLSAYAHCENIYVKEGDVIQQGSRIATMGDSGTNRVMLHFEIRYKGNPVNPLKYLTYK